MATSDSDGLNDKWPNTMPEPIAQAVLEYYEHYYRELLALPDWQARAQARLTEERTARSLIDNVEGWFGEHYGSGKRILVVGGGTGAEFVEFTLRGCDVFAVEPDSRAVGIGRRKAQTVGTDPARFLRGVGEQLPFEDNRFDLVWCWTVLEHVQDVEAVVSEMIRVTRPRGRIYIGTPDYRHIYEPHYKLLMPMAAPKWLLRLWLRAIGRPPAFLKTLQFVNSKQLANIFQNHPVTAFFVIHSWPVSLLQSRSWLPRMTVQLTRTFGIQRDQHWILQKLDRPRE